MRWLAASTRGLVSPRGPIWGPAVMAASALAVLTGCSDPPTEQADSRSEEEVAVTPGENGTQPADAEVVLAAGDIAGCDSGGDEQTAELLGAHPGATVLTLGDNVYASGSAQEFVACYGPTWGQARDRTHPSLGNHEYGQPGATGYFGYFGDAAGENTDGYYSFDLGAWHLIALNSNCDLVGCGVSSEQEQWLRHDLATHPTRCTLAYWHHPRFSSGEHHGSNAATAALWQALQDEDVDLVLAGHEHNYERFSPMQADGTLADTSGIRSFVVGTGGRSHYAFGTPVPGSEARNDTDFGVLRLTLARDGYEWDFIAAAGGDFVDRGTARCR